MFRPAFGCCSTRKLVEIHNTRFNPKHVEKQLNLSDKIILAIHPWWLGSLERQISYSEDYLSSANGGSHPILTGNKLLKISVGFYTDGMDLCSR